MLGLLQHITTALKEALPTGRTLSEKSWAGRHRAILVLLWLHVPLICTYGLIKGGGVVHSFLECAIIAAFAAGASLRTLSPAWRSGFATVGLVGCSAVLVHLSGGLIEMHFHFFVMVAVVTLYQAWMPFLVAIAFVVVHHGTVGVIQSERVYNHASAIENPWRWALIHGLFIAAESAAGLVAWKMNERALQNERGARKNLQLVNVELDRAQALSHIGSWEWDVSENRVWWSDELHRIFGSTPGDFGATFDAFLEFVHPNDRDHVKSTVAMSLVDGSGFEYQTRIVRPDGVTRTVLAIGQVQSQAGEPIHLSGTVQDISDRKLLEEQIEYQAFHDSLTSLANRALFLDRVDHALRRQRRFGTQMAILYLDIDDFKTVNDSLGHQAGDQLLVDLAGRLVTSIRGADTVARLGGDEFGVLIEDVEHLEDAVITAERIIDLLEEPFDVEGTALLARVSIGIAVVAGDEEITSGDILRDADIAMYAAKRHGKGSYEMFEPEMQRAASERLNLKADLQRAVNQKEFVLHYQPIVRVDSGELKGAEALIRWVLPDGAMVSPLRFIPLAEETGLIVPIGEWVIGEACRTLASWRKSHPHAAPETIAVNISPVHFLHPHLVEEIRAALLRHDIDPSSLVLEITESVLVQDSRAVLDRLDSLKELGVGLALDDFGTGYSSLAYLRDFPIDQLKVDKSFIDSVALGPDGSALARAVIELGRALDLKVVAEGVEEGDQHAALQALGCDFAQGYLFSRPLPAEELRERFDQAPALPSAAAL
jgi:diguanylate cyclase (GGDEF)-like protein/PAS domain S-box-containing protein